MVQIHPPLHEPGTSYTPVAYYGHRYGDGVVPVFYIYGRVLFPQKWAPLLDPPSFVEDK